MPCLLTFICLDEVSCSVPFQHVSGCVAMELKETKLKSLEARNTGSEESKKEGNFIGLRNKSSPNGAAFEPDLVKFLHNFISMVA